MGKRAVIILTTTAIILVLILSCGYYYQSTRFNQHITINNVEVGGMTADKALKKLESTESKNIVYVGHKKIYDGLETKMGFTGDDLSNVKERLKEQRTIFPSSKAKNYSLRPVHVNQEQNLSMKKAIERQLNLLNKGLKAPTDAEAHLEQGKIVVSKSSGGTEYNTASLLRAYEKQQYNSIIHLTPILLSPIKADSPIINQEKKKLQQLMNRTVNYKVQDKVYTFKGSDVIQNASVSKNMTCKIDSIGILNKLKEINQSQSTLNKNYTFKTHSGSVISVKGESYGWAIDIKAESKRIIDAFEKGKTSLLAYNVYGLGWNVNGVGYHNPTNHGIGNTYVEVSIKEQRIWVYKDGQLKVTTPVVTGTHVYNEDTPKGVWYIEYKQSPSTLKGSEVGNSHYSIKVSYWAPFTLSGCGFHDASWRKNWSSKAYLTQGSGGCVNTPPSVMKKVYDNLTQNEPVIVY